MGERAPDTASEQPSEPRLDSWKEIAAYLGRDVTTVQRWEKRETMPVHRHVHAKRGSVYALAPELDAWLRTRRQQLVADEPAVDAATDPPLASAVPTRIWLALAAVAIIVLLVGVYIKIRPRPANTAQPKIGSLAVLPMKNLSGDPTQEYLADGMTEALIARLSTMHGLRVISRTSVMQFKNPQLSVPQIAKMLHVDAVVEGSIMRQDNRVRVTVQLIRGSTDEHFWSETYDRDLRDVFAVQSELAQSIARKVQVTITGAEHARLIAARPVAPEVYESYLKGRFAVNQNSSRANVEESIAYFEIAIKLDPTFAPAYVGVAAATTQLGTVFFGASPEETRPKVISAARKALELDPDLGGSACHPGKRAAGTVALGGRRNRISTRPGIESQRRRRSHWARFMAAVPGSYR